MIISLKSVRADISNSGTTRSNTKALHQFDDDDPRRLNHLSLEQQKKQAKELLRERRAGGSPDSFKLSDAQHQIARQLGFNNWMALKAYIDLADAERSALAGGEPCALDAGGKVLHIRCGQDIQQALAIAGFNGDFLSFPDPYVHGPLPQTDDPDAFVRARAAYISSDGNPPLEQVYQHLSQCYGALDKARDYDAVYLWFEHDSHDQLILAKLLDFFSDDAKRPRSLQMISITHYPGVQIFNGIGQLPPEAMRVLWRQFAPVTKAQLSLGQKIWFALRQPSPDALRELIATGTPPLPAMARALSRHLKQLPSTYNGLNLTENLTLKILHEKGPMNAARLFGWYTNHYEPLTFMGDSGYWHVLEDLATAVQPAIVLEKSGDEPKHWQASLTATGARLLAGQADWLTLNIMDRWVGGIHIDSENKRIFRETLMTGGG